LRFSFWSIERARRISDASVASLRA
jgi:hypothetical protein